MPSVYICWLCGILGLLPSDLCSALWIITATYGAEASAVYRSSNPSLRCSTSPYASSKDETKIAGANSFDSTRNQSTQGKIVKRLWYKSFQKKPACVPEALNPKTEGAGSYWQGGKEDCMSKELVADKKDLSAAVSPSFIVSNSESFMKCDT